MARKLFLVGSVALGLLPGCYPTEEKTTLVTDNPFGRPPVVQAQPNPNLPRGSLQTAARVDQVAMRIMSANRQLGLRPRFHTIGAPQSELDWLIEHGTLGHLLPGDEVVNKGSPVDTLYFVLKGRVSALGDVGGTPRKVMDWRDGDATGVYPYSRIAVSANNGPNSPATSLRPVRSLSTQFVVSTTNRASDWAKPNSAPNPAARPLRAQPCCP